MRKHIRLLAGITLVVTACTAIAGISLYVGRNRTMILEYDLYGDPAIADGITYTTSLGDDQEGFYVDISNTIGGESQAATHFSSYTEDDIWSANWYSFQITYGIDGIQLSDSDIENMGFADLTDYERKMVEDCSARTESGTYGDFTVNLQDYLTEMPYSFTMNTKRDLWLTISAPEELNALFSIPILDPYYVDIQLEKDENGDLTYIYISGENYYYYPYDITGIPIEDGSAFLFYLAPSYKISENANIYSNTDAWMWDSGHCGLYRADIAVETLETYEYGTLEDGTLDNVVQLTKLADLTGNQYYIGGNLYTPDSVLSDIDAHQFTAVADKALMLLQSDNNVIIEIADKDGICDSMEIPLSETYDMDWPLSLVYVYGTEEGVICCGLSNNALITFQGDSCGNLAYLLTSKLITAKEESELLVGTFPDYLDYIGYPKGSFIESEIMGDVYEYDTLEYPYNTWYGDSMVYKDGKIAFIKQVGAGDGSRQNPGSVFVTVYDKDGLQYAGFFRNQYTTYVMRGFDETDLFTSGHYIDGRHQSEDIKAVWN